jgi:hypothetical protein
MSERKRQKPGDLPEEIYNKGSKIIISDVAITDVAQSHRTTMRTILQRIFVILEMDDENPAYSVNKSGENYLINIVAKSVSLDNLMIIREKVHDDGIFIKGHIDDPLIKIMIRIPYENFSD